MNDILDQDKMLQWLEGMQKQASQMAFAHKNELITIKLYAQAAAFHLVHQLILEGSFDVEDMTGGTLQ